MDDAEVWNEGIVHVLPEERGIVEGIEGDPIRTNAISNLSTRCYYRQPYSFNRSSCDFFGIISSICGASRGYVSTIFVRMAR